MAQLVKSRRKKKPADHFVATCGAGLEELVAEEIRTHGGDKPSISPGAVSWEGRLESGYRMCLWSRFASRILFQIASFTATDPDMLYREASKLNWDEHFSGKTTFAVFSTISDSPISHSKYAALRIKDAIVDQFRARTGRRPDVDLAQPGIRVNLHLRGENATLAIDLSGDSLHRRGYRSMGVEAPLKETLAAGIARLAGFTSGFPADATLLDPMCGSGTLLIEAAMIYGDVAPGLQRKTFGFLAWKYHKQKMWERLVNEALQREEEGLLNPWPRIIGSDANPKAVQAARQNIEMAGFEDKIQIKQRQFSFLERSTPQGMVLFNPPYGERLSEVEQVKYLYRCIGRIISRELYDWKVGFFAANPDLAGSLKIKWDETINLYNGSIRCKLYKGKGQEAIPVPSPHPVLTTPDSDMQAIDLAHRLAKNYTSLQPWAEKEEITCFRVYDADIPEYNFSVDLYGELAHVSEYPAPVNMDKNKARNRFQAGLNAVRHVFGIPPSRLFIKTPQHRSAKKQSTKKQKKKKYFEVLENNCRFLVNFTDYPETGMVIGQRKVRKMIGQQAQGKKFLNLYGSTGTETVHAIMHNAIATTTVDSSSSNLQRAKNNFALNGFGGPQHETVQKDCLQWIKYCKERYGLILVTPPSLTRDREGEKTFSVQEDHELLLQLSMQQLSRDGILIFTTSHPNFTLADSLHNDFVVREITEETIPRDFKNSSQGHRCWEFRHHPEAE